MNFFFVATLSFFLLHIHRRPLPSFPPTTDARSLSDTRRTRHDNFVQIRFKNEAISIQVRTDLAIVFHSYFNLYSYVFPIVPFLSFHEQLESVASCNHARSKEHKEAALFTTDPRLIADSSKRNFAD